MMGSKGWVVQADSTWCSERRVVRPTRIVADLAVPVVRAAVVRQTSTAPRSIGYAFAWRERIPIILNDAV